MVHILCYSFITLKLYSIHTYIFFFNPILSINGESRFEIDTLYSWVNIHILYSLDPKHSSAFCMTSVSFFNIYSVNNGLSFTIKENNLRFDFLKPTFASLFHIFNAWKMRKVVRYHWSSTHLYFYGRMNFSLVSECCQ